MTGRERFLTALDNGKPDRLPCQVHNWMDYYLKQYLEDANQFEAYERLEMDPVIYAAPEYVYAEEDLANWRIESKASAMVGDSQHSLQKIFTPDGELTFKTGANEFTEWTTEYPIKNERDFEIWNRFVPVPKAVNWSKVIEAKRRIGDRGIVRSSYFDFGQGSPWQSFCCLFGTEEAIMAAYDKPEWLEYVLKSMLDKKLRAIECGGEFELDLVETGGGAGSSTVISPDMHRRFCLPYDKIQHESLHRAGTRVVYHLCGGLMDLLEIVADNGADALETMTPGKMGGDCDLAEATRRVGDKICFIGGLDQNKGFENGNPQLVAEMVKELFQACPEGGYICSPSDHFFFGNPENIRTFASTARDCSYE